jgi:hypothetical protein
MMLLHQTICRFIYILAFSVLLCLCATDLYAQADTTASDTTEVKVHKKDLAGHQLCIGVDIFRPIMSIFQTDRYGYEAEANYYLHNEYFLAAEGGWGGAQVSYPDLQYTSANSFLRLGFNKSVLVRNKPDDWDMMFIGLRAAVANIVRSSGSYVVVDSLWGSNAGSLGKSPSFNAYWLELNGGVRVEIAKNVMVGWNARAKFLMNGKSIPAPAPIYIAGYGKGDKNAAFDFNAYISYAIRWKKKRLEIADTAAAGIPVLKPVAPADSTHITKPPARENTNNDSGRLH